MSLVCLEQFECLVVCDPQLYSDDGQFFLVNIYKVCQCSVII